MKKIGLLIFALIYSCSLLTAQDAEEKEGWKTGAGLGLDFTQLLLINPKVGAGENKIGLGSAINFYAKYTKNRVVWNNTAGWLFGVQKLGNLPIAETPFQKSLDELRLASNFNFKFAENSKWAYAADLTFLSQVTPTYPGNFLSDLNGEGAIAKFFAPATITFTPGVSYIPNEHFNILISPAAVKLIVVGDKGISDLGTHITKLKDENVPGEYVQAFTQVGGAIRATYTNKYFKDRMNFSTTLSLFSAYNNNPQNIDVEWITSTDILIFKGLSLNLSTSLFYDHDVLVLANDRSDDPLTVDVNEKLGRRISFVEQILIKYNYVF